MARYRLRILDSRTGETLATQEHQCDDDDHASGLGGDLEGALAVEVCEVRGGDETDDEDWYTEAELRHVASF